MRLAQTRCAHRPAARRSRPRQRRWIRERPGSGGLFRGLQRGPCPTALSHDGAPAGRDARGARAGAARRPSSDTRTRWSGWQWISRRCDVRRWKSPGLRCRPVGGRGPASQEREDPSSHVDVLEGSPAFTIRRPHRPGNVRPGGDGQSWAGAACGGRCWEALPSRTVRHAPCSVLVTRQGEGDGRDLKPHCSLFAESRLERAYCSADFARSGRGQRATECGLHP